MAKTAKTKTTPAKTITTKTTLTMTTTKNYSFLMEIWHFWGVVAIIFALQEIDLTSFFMCPIWWCSELSLRTYLFLLKTWLHAKLIVTFLLRPCYIIIFLFSLMAKTATTKTTPAKTITTKTTMTKTTTRTIVLCV